MKVAIIGSKTYQGSKKIKDFIFKLIQELGDDVWILSGGSIGVENSVKKHARSFGLEYREYNPAYTVQNLYSALPLDYYGKEYHGSMVLHRYYEMLYKCTHLVVFIEPNVPLGILETVVKRANKLKKPVIIIN
jgi:hypothetical protein